MALNNPKEWKSSILTTLGPLMPLLENDRITEIEVNAWDTVFCKGLDWPGHKLFPEIKFRDHNTLTSTCTALTDVTGKIINSDNPSYDGRLPGGERIHIEVPPTCAKVSITIRKFPAEVMTLDKMLHFNSINEQIAMMLKGFVMARKNLLSSGGTNSGKTSLLNSLLQFIPKTQRIITNEENRELKVIQPNHVALETRPNTDPQSAKQNIELSHLIQANLRMCPDRIVVGECRGDEALFMLRAFSTGHSGGFSTIHANSAIDALDQAQLLAMLNPGASFGAATVAQMVGKAIQVIVHLEQFEEDGSRKITEIIEIERPAVLFKAHGVIDYNTRTLMRWETSGISPKGMVEGEWVYPQRPSKSMIRTIKAKSIPWPEESLSAPDKIEDEDD
jgi:pilus assembly protein CpaF